MCKSLSTVPFGHTFSIELEPEHQPIIRMRRKVEPKRDMKLKRQIGFNREVGTWVPQGINFDKFLSEQEHAEDLDALLVVEPGPVIDLPENWDDILVAA